MKDSKVCILTLILLVTGMMLLSGTAWSDTVVKPLWSAYHENYLLTGQDTARSPAISNPATLNPIWTFPRVDQSVPTEQQTIVDGITGLQILNPSQHVWMPPSSYVPPFPAGFVFTDAYDTGCLVAPAQSSSLTPTPVGYGVQWQFPAGLPQGYYQVEIWVPTAPSGLTFSSQAQYTVQDDSGANTYTFDQGQNGGYWAPLTDTQFRFAGASKQPYTVTLTTVTDDDPGDITTNNIMLAADAVKFVPCTGMNIYSSPASAQIYVPLYDPANPTKLIWPSGNPTAVVYVGTVEQPLVNSTNTDNSGAMYCINSVTPTTESLATYTTDPTS